MASFLLPMFTNLWRCSIAGSAATHPAHTMHTHSDKRSHHPCFACCAVYIYIIPAVTCGM
jgi:hypothetical protein